MKLVSVETPEKSVCKMTFSASAEELEAASNAVYERTRATYTIKGFAKGEADRAQIEADRGEHTFWYDAINDLMDKDVPALYDAAMAEHGFHAVDEPVYDLVSVKKDEGFVATATTALQPELSLTQTTGFKTECVTPEVTDKEIDAVLERRRAMAAELVPHKGPAVKGNIVHIDYEGLLEGKPFNGGTAQNQTLQLGSGRMIPGFEEGILGHKGGEAFNIFVTFPARYHVKDLAGKPVVFKIKLHEVKYKELPALDDELAKDCSEYDTLDEFKASIRKNNQEQLDKQDDLAVENALVDQVIDGMEAEIPQAMYDVRMDELVNDFAFRMEQQGLRLEDYLKYMGQSVDQFRASFMPQAEKQVKIRLALEAVAAAENIEASEDELNAEVKRIADQYKMEEDKVRDLINVDEVKHDLAINKAIDFIKSHANVVEKAAEAEKTEDAQ